jgi:hypothetical protein
MSKTTNKFAPEGCYAALRNWTAGCGICPRQPHPRRSVHCWSPLWMMIEDTNVASDMARVFSALSDAGRPTRPNRPLGPRQPGPGPGPGPGRPGHSLARWALLLITAALAIALVSYVALRSREPVNTNYVPESRMPVQAAPSTVTVPQQAPVPAPSSIAPVTVRPLPVQPPAAVSAGRDDRQPDSETTRDLPRTTIRQTASSSTAKKGRSAAPAQSKPVRDALLCHEARDQDACFYSEVSSADERLRQAYNRAVDSTLTVSELAKVRRSWSRALSRSRREPFEAIMAIDQLTTRLYNDIQAASRERYDD